MTKTVEGVLTIVRGMKSRERRELFKAFVTSRILTEEEEDSLVIESRRGGTTRPLNDFVREMRKKGRLH